MRNFLPNARGLALAKCLVVLQEVGRCLLILIIMDDVFLGICVFPVCRTQSQIGFLSFVVLDQFRALADLLPAVSELVVQGEKNLDMWQQCLDALKAAEEAQKSVVFSPVVPYKCFLESLQDLV